MTRVVGSTASFRFKNHILVKNSKTLTFQCDANIYQSFVVHLKMTVCTVAYISDLLLWIFITLPSLLCTIILLYFEAPTPRIFLLRSSKNEGPTIWGPYPVTCDLVFQSGTKRGEKPVIKRLFWLWRMSVSKQNYSVCVLHCRYSAAFECYCQVIQQLSKCKRPWPSIFYSESFGPLSDCIRLEFQLCTT